MIHKLTGSNSILEWKQKVSICEQIKKKSRFFVTIIKKKNLKTPIL